MDAKFKAWILELNKTAPESQKAYYLYLSKNRPHIYLANISILIPEWVIVYEKKTGEKIVISDLQKDAEEITLALQEQFTAELAVKQVEKCISCLEDSTAQIATHCKVCNAPLCAGHIFECRDCNEPMCNTCWGKYGKDFCPTCLGETPGSFRFPV